MKIVDYYFDFMSPYAYLACTQIPGLRDAFQGRAQFVGHSFDMWAARLASGNTGPSNRDVPARARVLMADVARWADRYGVRVTPPRSSDTTRLNRAFLVARNEGREIEFMTEAFARLWGAGGDPREDILLVEAAAAAGLDGGDVLDRADSDEGADLYAQENQGAQARGVFGAPMFAVDDELWWGNDRLSWVEDYLDKNS